MHEAAYPCPYGDYVLLERLGVGGMSQVDLARKAVADADFVRFLVIKRIKADRTDDDSFVRMFKDEARITAELHHANIAQVYDFGRVADEYYMALEFVPGMDLRRIINTLRERRKRVPLRVALRVLCDVLEALQYAHNKVDQLGRPMQIVHRDVNPRNVMISVRGEVKLIDFGVAKATGRLERTRTDHVKGKFAYMAPEQVTASEVDHRADLFAVGLTLHELITGYGPFHNMTQVQIMHRLLSGRMPAFVSPPELPDPEPLRRVHAKSMECDVELRYQNAREMVRDLENVAAPLGGLATQEEMVEFLSHVDPDIGATVQQKIEDFSQKLELRGTQGGSVRLVPAGELDGSMSGVVPTTTSRPGDTGTGVARTGLLAGGLFLGAFSGAGLIAAAVIALVVLAFREQLFPAAAPEGPLVGEVVDVRPPSDAVAPGTGEPAIDAPRDTEPPGSEARVVAPSDPKVVTHAEPRVVETSEHPPSTTKAAVITKAPPADEPTEAPGTSEPPPVVEAPPVVVAPPVDPPADPPVEVVAAADFGTLQVASVEKGRAVSIDGKDTGKRTPAEIELAVGSHVVSVDGYAPQTIEVRKDQRKPVIFR